MSEQPIKTSGEPKRKQTAKKWIMFVIRWGIAVAGIGWVLSNISLYNQVLIANPATGRPLSVRVVRAANESDAQFQVIGPSGATMTVPRSDLLVKSDRDQVSVRGDDGQQSRVEVLALKVAEPLPREKWPLLVARPRTLWMKYVGGNWGDVPQLVDPSRVVGDYSVRVPYPIIETGLGPMTADAFNSHPLYLILAVVVMPITFVITSIRWHWLLRLLDIHVPLGRVYVINMVGAFYNTFMPGSTGGDLLKAYYAAKQTPHRTRAVMSVIIDRILGLLALVILGGTMAAVQYFSATHHDEATRKCGQVALGSLLIVLAAAGGAAVFYLRKPLRLDRLIARLPMQRQVVKATDAMEVYRRHPLVILSAIVMTLPVHGTVVLSAMFAGLAFGLRMHPAYYWVAVPVIVLAGSIPISPQGAGVMEFFAILLTRSQGVTVSQAFALTMSIRVVQILWNLTGGIFVLRGGYHAPSEKEQEEMQTDGAEEGGKGGRGEEGTGEGTVSGSVEVGESPQ
jgi:uncharacterized protein (TIRG00374 family)